MRIFKTSLMLTVMLSFVSVTLMAINPSDNSCNLVVNESTAEKKHPVEQESLSKLNEESAPNHLLIVWTSGDPEVAHKMVFMYAYNAQKNAWWDQVTLLVWGPSSKLSSEDPEIQEALKKMKAEGVELLACKGCADQYGVSSDLENLGVEVKYTGTYLTDFIKSGKKIISF